MIRTTMWLLGSLVTSSVYLGGLYVMTLNSPTLTAAGGVMVLLSLPVLAAFFAIM